MSSIGPLKFRAAKPGRAVKPGTTLRILGVGDSITVGFLSDLEGGDGNGYRFSLRQNLSKDDVVFSGTESVRGTIPDNFFAAWNGMTIKFISDHARPSLDQRPNIVLVHAGTNDMNPNLDIAREGNDPKAAAERLGKLIDKIIDCCSDAVILVAMIINTLDDGQQENTVPYQGYIPGIVTSRQVMGKRVIAVDFTTFPTQLLRDGIHPTNEGYRHFGDYWYDFITQIPSDWIQPPAEDDLGNVGSSMGESSSTEDVSWLRRVVRAVFGKGMPEGRDLKSRD